MHANMKAFLVNRVGDFGFLLGIGAIVMFWFGTLDYARVFERAPGCRRPGRVLPGCLLVSLMT
jgi:NADH-quinone oxidoreductase subunit L